MKDIRLATLLIGMTVAAGPAASASAYLRELCGTGGTVHDRQTIEAYGESLALQGVQGYITSGKAIWVLRATNINLGERTYAQGKQEERMQELAKAAFLTGTPVNFCANPAMTPNEIWVIEMAR